MIKVKVPATTANLGPGFDIIGAALNLYNIFELREATEDKVITSGSYNSASLPLDNNNLVFYSINKTFEYLNQKRPNFEIIAEIEIPLSRGLGSSSTAIIAGIMLANTYLGKKISDSEIIRLANQIEGHPDNIAPCYLGGIIISMQEKDKVYTRKINTNLDLKFICLIPDFELSTKASREVLPKLIDYKDAIFNASHLAFLLNALENNDPELLKISLQDRLHHQYRGKLINGFDNVLNKAVEYGAIGSVLSGAGPTILALSLENELKIAEEMQKCWQSLGINSEYKILRLENLGAIYLN